jgi:hypothetical protein
MRFRPGQPPVPGAGRPLGAKNRLCKQFLNDLLEVWQEDGRAALRIAVREDPTAFCRMVAGLVPRELLLGSTVSELDDGQIAEMLIELEHLRASPMLIEGKIAEHVEVERAKQN